KEDVQQIPALWADCDSDEAVAALATFPFKPTIEIETSPGHRHWWWLLKEPLDVSSQETADQVEGVLRGIADILRSDKSVAELARVLRVPGTQNVKRGAPVRLLRKDGPRYNLSDFVDKGIFRARRWVPVNGNGNHPEWVAAALEGVDEHD